MAKDDDQSHPKTDDSVEDEEDDDSTDDVDESEDDEDDDDNTALIDAIVERVAEKTSSQIDSRVNSLVKTLTKDYGLKKRSDDDDGDKSKSKTVATRNRGLDRVLRGAVREATNEAFDDPKERKAALVIAKQIADARGLGEDEDEDEVAEEIIESVTEFMASAKVHYESALRKDFEQRGLIEPEPPKQPGKKGTKTQTGKSPSELFKQGQAKAKVRFGQDKE